jgi:Helicase associated domain
VAKPAVGWEKRYQQLIDYKNLSGDCNVPQSYPPDKPFGRWVMKQRCQHSLKLRGEKSQLTDERENKLNAIEFSWVAPGFTKKTVTMPGGEEEEGIMGPHHGVELDHVVAHQVAVAAAAASAHNAGSGQQHDNNNEQQELSYHHQEQQQQHPGLHQLQQQQLHHTEFSWTGV